MYNCQLILLTIGFSGLILTLVMMIKLHFMIKNYKELKCRMLEHKINLILDKLDKIEKNEFNEWFIKKYHID